METTQPQESRDTNRWGLIGAVGAAVAASLCCLGPLLLLFAGVSGAWIGNLTALEPYRPIFMVVTIGFLGFAFYRVYRKPGGEECEPGSYCANPHAGRINKAALWIVTALTVGLLAFPYLVPYVSAGNSGQQPLGAARTTLDVQNMTCSSCVVTVRNSLTRLDGVKEATVTLEPPEAVVVYDPQKVSTEALIEATTNAGYPSNIRSRADGGE
jgi:mercuric transport protein